LCDFKQRIALGLLSIYPVITDLWNVVLAGSFGGFGSQIDEIGLRVGQRVILRKPL